MTPYASKPGSVSFTRLAMAVHTLHYIMFHKKGLQGQAVADLIYEAIESAYAAMKTAQADLGVTPETLLETGRAYVDLVDQGIPGEETYMTFWRNVCTINDAIEVSLQ